MTSLDDGLMAFLDMVVGDGGGEVPAHLVITFCPGRRRRRQAAIRTTALPVFTPRIYA